MVVPHVVWISLLLSFGVLRSEGQNGTRSTDKPQPSIYPVKFDFSYVRLPMIIAFAVFISSIVKLRTFGCSVKGFMCILKNSLPESDNCSCMQSSTLANRCRRRCQNHGKSITIVTLRARLVNFKINPNFALFRNGRRV